MNIAEYVKEGTTLARNEEYDKAVESYTEALEIDPHNVLAWISKGMILSNIGRSDEALESYKEELLPRV
jgi:Flp pilus assembly protein TadD